MKTQQWLNTAPQKLMLSVRNSKSVEYDHVDIKYKFSTVPILNDVFLHGHRMNEIPFNNTQNFTYMLINFLPKVLTILRKKVFENMRGKGESAGDQHFVISQQCFLPCHRQIPCFE